VHNSVSSHLRHSARNYLETAYTGRWLWKQEPVSWPKSFIRPECPSLLSLGKTAECDVSFSCGYWRGTGAAPSKWLCLRP
jgi:hypothetical protein